MHPLVVSLRQRLSFIIQIPAEVHPAYFRAIQLRIRATAVVDPTALPLPSTFRPVHLMLETQRIKQIFLMLL